MGKEDKPINYKEENELLRNEIEFLNSRINTLIKEVAANGETIKARDAKCKELVAASNKNAKTAKYYRDKLSAAVKMYEEEAYSRDQKLKELEAARKRLVESKMYYKNEVKVLEHWLKGDSEEIKKLKEVIKQNEEDLYYMNQKQKDYVINRAKKEEQIRELQEEVVSLRRKNRELEAIRKTEIATLEDQIDSLLVVFSDVEKKNDIYKDEIRKLNAACKRKNDLINKLYGALNYDGWSKMWEDNHE